MKTWGNVVAALVFIVGLVWTLQGANLIGGSFMSGRALWLYIGIVMVISALGALFWINVVSR